MPDLASAVNNLLSGTTGALTARLYEIGKDAATDAAEWPLAQIIEHLDKRICDLCRHVNGRIVRKGTAEHARWRLPSHINCRRIMVDIHKDEVDNEGNPTQPDLTEPPAGVSKEAWQKIIGQHGHFLNDPLKYKALRLPARPTGRDFIFARGAEGQPGQLIFARLLPDAILRQTLEQVSMPIIEAATNGEVFLPGDGNILTQCARQSANRQWYDHLETDVAHHRADWGAEKMLSPQEYKQLSGEVLDSDPWVAALNYQSEKYGEVPAVVFHAPSVTVGKTQLQDVSLIWDADRATIWHPGRLQLDDLTSEPGFRPLSGDW